MKLAFGPISLILTISLMSFGVAAAQDKPPAAAAAEKPQPAAPASEAEQAIRQTAKEFADAFNRGDAAAVAACWTDDGDYIDEDGTRYQGKAEIEKAYAAFLGGHLGVQMRIVVDSVRLVGADTALEDGRASLGPFPQVPPSFSRYTVVHVKQDGKWRMTVTDFAVHRSRSLPTQGLVQVEELFDMPTFGEFQGQGFDFIPIRRGQERFVTMSQKTVKLPWPRLCLGGDVGNG